MIEGHECSQWTKKHGRNTYDGDTADIKGDWEEKQSKQARSQGGFLVARKPPKAEIVGGAHYCVMRPLIIMRTVGNLRSMM